MCKLRCNKNIFCCKWLTCIALFYQLSAISYQLSKRRSKLQQLFFNFIFFFPAFFGFVFRKTVFIFVKWYSSFASICWKETSRGCNATFQNSFKTSSGCFIAAADAQATEVCCFSTAPCYTATFECYEATLPCCLATSSSYCAIFKNFIQNPHF